MEGWRDGWNMLVKIASSFGASPLRAPSSRPQIPGKRKRSLSRSQRRSEAGEEGPPLRDVRPAPAARPRPARGNSRTDVVNN